jgi:hypothetical protein
MRTRPLPARLATTALLSLATIATSTCLTAPGAAAAHHGCTVTLRTDPAATDYDHRHTDLSGTVTHADGTPVANADVELNEFLVFDTWNPWGDPIDPEYVETNPLGTLHTDADGKFSLAQVLVDHTTDSSLINSAHRVDFTAGYDVDGDPNTPQDSCVGQSSLTAEAVPSTLTYHVNKTRVHAGDTLTVTGTVGWADGHGPVAGTEVFLRTYYENEYRVKTTTDEKGAFTLSARVRDYDNEFVVFSAPRDYYVAGETHTLPVTNQS